MKGKFRKTIENNNDNMPNRIRIDFSLKREVFFVVVGALVGAIVFGIGDTILQIVMDLPYDFVWITFGHVIGIDSSTFTSIIAGILIHLITSVSIGIVIGIFLYKTNILNISKISNGLIYGIFAGSVVFIAFFIPVYEFILSDQMIKTIMEINPGLKVIEVKQEMREDLPSIIIGSLIIHLIFGVTVGLISSFLSIRFGTRYRCSECNISFRRLDLYRKHKEKVHGLNPIPQTRILILGGGFGGIEALNYLQKAFQDDVRIDITLVSKDNFFLFTPMLPEVSFGSVDTRHILTPIRNFCKRARFHEANIESIKLKTNQVIISHEIGKNSEALQKYENVLEYDYLLIAVGSETNFFGNPEIDKYSFAMKSVGDAILVKNHIIKILEHADTEHENKELINQLMTFVVVGGGFSGIETIGELNDFVRESIKDYYHYINEENIRIILVNSGNRLLPEVPENLAKFTLEKLRKNKITVLLNSRVCKAEPNKVILNDGTSIYSNTIIWTGGVKPGSLIEKIENCEHDQKSGKILTDQYLQIKGWDNAYAIGDCALIMDNDSGKPYPPTAQHAIVQAKTATENLIYSVNQHLKNKTKRTPKVLKYKTKGIMALIGKRNGVGVLFGIKIHGIVAWMFWRLYYLGNLPTLEKKIRVLLDWSIDLLFKRDVTRI